jgi:uncharacterized protein (TIGR00297 family)
MQQFSGIILGAVIGYLAWRLRALSTSGAWAAAITGALIFGLGGLRWAILLLAFFVTSSALSRLFGRRKKKLEEKFSKGSQRDAAQVLANGGLGALLVLLHWLQPEASIWWLAFAGTLAAVNADTWATELGVLSPQSPRLLTTGQVVERGASGGVTLLGYLAAAAGSGLIALLAAWLAPQYRPGVNPLGLGLCVWLAGLAGCTLDSLLGATVQAIYRCPACQKETERHPYHTCGAQTMPLRGWLWLGNDVVNGLASLAGAVAASILGALLLF